MICLDGSGALLRKGCACRGSSSWAHGFYVDEPSRPLTQTKEPSLLFRRGHTA
jgi:hypothetical protein